MDPTSLTRKTPRDATADAAAQADFNAKRRVWIPDQAEGFVPGWIKGQDGEDSDPNASAEVVLSTSGETREVPLYSLSPMNPPQFDGVDDIADLTHLNEASVINNLKLRYGAGSIYTYSGLFLISLNPYRSLPIYTPRIVAQYRHKRREENPPHIFAVAERAWQQIGEEKESQSILITGESGAGKTENTKKVIQYLAAIASSKAASLPESSSSALTRSKSQSLAPAIGLPRSSSFKGKEVEEVDLIQAGEAQLGLLERQILQANPILEAFGNAQTMRNNNSSRFGKFIKIYIAPNGAIAGANIDWYLLEKSRVTARAEGERCFHVFYQLLRGMREAGLADKLLLEDGPEKYDFLKKSRKEVSGVDDLAEWRDLKNALDVVGFSLEEQFELFRVPALVLHIGNMQLSGSGPDQAFVAPESHPVVDKICHLLGISVSEFTKTILRPKVRAGREWVTQSRSRKQAEDELAALCKHMYEKTFGWMVERINKALDRPSAKALSIGVLDIAGFEIFEENSYEQLLINFTNEKLQQFFNFHMFTLEQEEYAREGIEWNYVNFGLDLQPTIELIESSMPVGILSCLDEECIMPKATDRSFTDKLQDLWEPPKGMTHGHPGAAKFSANRNRSGFIVKHYAGDVEYRTEGWLEKNKDPINDAVARLCAQSDIPSVASMFADYVEDTASTGVVKKVKRGAFRTVGQRHKEQLGQLMNQLSSTQPHFVRCIVPNSEKKPTKVEVNLVLDQLRCNGVLEGIRIARLGYPNRHSFAEFRARYEVLAPGSVSDGFVDGRKAAEKIAEALRLDRAFYKVGATKIFFKAGVLAELEERRDNLLTDLFRRFQSAARMYTARRRIRKLSNRAQAIRTIQRNARVYIQLRDWPWWSLYVKVRPLLAATKADDELGKRKAELLMAKEREERDEKERQKLEELKAALLADKIKVEEHLESERQLGRDRDMMLNRLKAREAELMEKVAELQADLDVLGADREEAIGVAEKVKAKLERLQLDFDAMMDQATLLEKQGADFKKREADLLTESRSRSSDHSRLEQEKAELTRLVENLRRDVSQKEEVTKRARERNELSVKELEKRLQLERTKTESSGSQVLALNEELRRLIHQFDEQQSLIQNHENNIAGKQRELADLESRQATNAKAQEAIEAAKATLQVKIDDLTSQLSDRDKERQDHHANRQELEKQLDGLRQTMAAKSDEDIRRREVDNSREAEMSRLRDQTSTLQKSLDDHRESSAKMANQLRVDVEGLKSSHQAAQRDLKASQAILKKKEEELAEVRKAVDAADERRRGVEIELREVRAQKEKVESDMQAVGSAKDEVERKIQDMQEKYNELEDAVLLIEDEKSDWATRIEATSRQLAEEASKRQLYEQQLHNSNVELASHRNTALEAERSMAKHAGEMKARDAEIALLRSRENKTIVEHVHVLEQAKKVTDRQLAEQMQENTRLNMLMKSVETHRNRLVADMEDMSRQHDMLKAEKGREARATRASMSIDDRELIDLLEDERAARKLADAKIASLEKDLQDQRRHLSKMSLTAPTRDSSGLQTRLVRTQDELSRLGQEHEDLLSLHSRIKSELSDLRSLRPPSTPKMTSHDLFRASSISQADDGPLTPSRLQNGHFSPMVPPSPDPMGGKRMRQLEGEINGLRQQLEDEREEKEMMYQQLQHMQNGGKLGSSLGVGKIDQAMYSHFRLKARSLRTQLDHWLTIEDSRMQGQHTGGSARSSNSSAPFAEDVQQLKDLLSQLEVDGGSLR